MKEMFLLVILDSLVLRKLANSGVDFWLLCFIIKKKYRH